MNRKRIYLCSVSVVIMILFIGAWNPMPVRQWEQNELTSFVPGGGYFKEAGTGFEGAAIETPVFSIGPGLYTIGINYDSKSSDNYITLFSKRDNKNYAVENNVLPQNSNSVKEIEFSVNEPVYSVQVQVNSPEDSDIYVRTIQIRNDKGWLKENIILAALLAAAAAAGYFMLCHAEMSEDNRTAMFCICVITAAVSCPLFSNGIFRGADFSFHAGRIEGAAYALKGGQFPVRIHEKVFADYGHAVSIFYPEFFIYIPAVLTLLGISLVTSVQIFLFLVNLATAVHMYIACRAAFKSSNAGLIGAVLYAAAPYRLINMYSRFAIGETLAMCFLPLVIYGLYEICEGNAKKWAWFVLGFSGVLQSHIITTLFTGIVCFLLVCMYGRSLKKENIKAILLSGVFIILLNLWFIIPFLQYMAYGEINTERLQKEDLNLFTVHLSQLFHMGIIEGNGTGGVSVGRSLSSALPLRIGAAIWIAFVIGLSEYVKKRKKDSIKLPLYAAVLGGICLWASTYLFPWNFIAEVPFIGKIFQYIQFPYRLLSYASVFLCFLDAFLLGKAGQKRFRTHFTVIAFSALLIAGSFFESFMLQDWVIYRGEASNGYAVSQGEYLPAGTNIDDIFLRGSKTAVSSTNLSVTEYEKEGTDIELQYVNHRSENESEHAFWIEVPFMYYPNYAAEMEGRQLEVSPGENNVLRVQLPPDDTGRISIHFEIPVLWRIAEYISVLTLIVFGWWNLKFAGRSSRLAP